MKKRIRSLDKYLSGISEGDTFCVVLNINQITQKALEKQHINLLSVNQSILPKAVGPISRFNAFGKTKALKHLPKEKRYICTREWIRPQWAGRGRTELVTSDIDVYRNCYQVEEILPPSEEISKINLDGAYLISSKEIIRNHENDAEIIHIINLFLEMFGGFQLLKDSRIHSIKTEKVNWKFLPPGERPWEEIISHIKKNNKKTKALTNVVIDRQKFMIERKPIKTYVGDGGFSQYIAYVFQKFTILESISLGNAMYIFFENWEALSKLTKAEILKNKQAQRIIHSKGWRKVANAIFEKN